MLRRSTRTRSKAGASAAATTTTKSKKSTPKKKATPKKKSTTPSVSKSATKALAAAKKSRAKTPVRKKSPKKSPAISKSAAKALAARASAKKTSAKKSAPKKSPAKKASKSPKKASTNKPKVTNANNRRSKSKSTTPSRRRSSTTTSTTAAAVAAAHGGSDAAFVYEFGGPFGAVATSIALPLVCYGFYFLCDEKSCPNMGKLTSMWSDPTAALSNAADGVRSSFTTAGFSVIFGWMFFQLLLDRYLPGAIGKGVVLKPVSKGRRLDYSLNGHRAYWVSFLLLAVWQTISVCQSPQGGFHSLLSKESGELIEGLGVCSVAQSFPLGTLPSLSWLDTHFIELLSASLAMSTIMSLLLYVASLRLPKGHSEVAPGGDSGIAVYDFFMGRELNPRPFGGESTFDLKYFCELRPGLIGWCVLNFGMLCSQMETNGMVTWSMGLINIFQLIYVWDALYNEKAILTTMDITTDGFGMMLAFGDLTWVPFTYSLQSRYLVHHDPSLSTVTLCLIVVMKCMGYAAFRGSNGEKDKFRTDPSQPSVAHLETITTRTGRKLLVSGWWGMARKINYSADWLMGLSWCSVCGTNSIIPYFYSIYFCILLIHRAWRDDHACHEKYGDDWERYKKKVPYVFIPGVI